MSVSRLLAWSGVLVLAVAVSVSGQQQPAGRGGGSPQPNAPARSIGGNVQHGQYLVERVVMCYECHSTRDAQGNIVPGTRFMGGPMPLRPAWPDWPMHIPRIAGFAGYSDEEAIRDQAGWHATAPADAAVPYDATGRRRRHRLPQDAVARHAGRVAVAQTDGARRGDFPMPNSRKS
jgi:hypothetical protein